MKVIIFYVEHSHRTSPNLHISRAHATNLSVYYIRNFLYESQSGTSSTSNNNRSSKSRPSSNNTSNNNSNHHSVASNNSNNNNNTNNGTNSVSTINKKNDSHPMNNRSQQISSKICNNSPKNSSQSTQQSNQKPNSISSPIAQTHLAVNKHQSCINLELQPQRNINKLLPQQQANLAVGHAASQLSQQRRSSQTHVKGSTELSQIEQTRLEKQVQHQSSPDIHCAMMNKLASHANQTQIQAAVTFAEHLVVRDEDIPLYSFGFFDDQTAQVQQNKATTPISNATLNRKPASQQKPQPKQSKASPKSEENSYTSDIIDANSFNYEQILKFISNGEFKSYPFDMLNSEHQLISTLFLSEQLGIVPRPSYQAH